MTERFDDDFDDDQALTITALFDLIDAIEEAVTCADRIDALRASLEWGARHRFFTIAPRDAVLARVSPTLPISSAEIPVGPQADDVKTMEPATAAILPPSDTKAPHEEAEGRVTRPVDALAPPVAGGGAKPRNPNVRPVWTEDEDARAIEMRVAGARPVEIAEALGRPRPGTEFRIYKVLKDRIIAAQIAARAKTTPGSAKIAEPAPVASLVPKDLPVHAPSITPPPVGTEDRPRWFRELDAMLSAIGYKAPWSPALDLELVEGLAKGLPKPVLADQLGVELGALKSRFVALTPDGQPTIEAQAHLLEVLRHRAAASVTREAAE